MIPIFTPATARKDVNKVPGDGELAKLANLNRLVENVNTIVANGIPAAGPTLTYTNTGPVTDMSISFGVVVDPSNVSNISGTKTVQSYYAPEIYIDNDNGNNSALTSIIFSDNVIFKRLEVSVDSLVTLSLPVATKFIGGSLNISNSSLETLNVPLLNYVSEQISLLNLPSLTSVDFSNLTYVFIFRTDRIAATSINLNLLNYVRDFSIDYADNLTSISLPQLTVFDGVQFSIINSSSLTNINLPALTSIDVADSFNIANLPLLTSLTLPNLSVLGNGEIRIGYNNLLATISFPALLSANNINVFNLPVLTSFSLPIVTNINGLNIDNVGLTSLSLPSFNTADNPISISNCDNLQSISMPLIGENEIVQLYNLPAFTTITLSNSIISSLQINDCPLFTSFSSPVTILRLFLSGTTALSSLTIPNVTNLRLSLNSSSSIASLSSTTVTSLFLGIERMSSFNSFNFPNLLHGQFAIKESSLTTLDLSATALIDIIEYCIIRNNSLLTSLTLGTIGGSLKTIGSTVLLQNNALNVASVNAVLAFLVSLDGTNGTTLFENNVNLSGGTNSAPTGQGLIDKQTLIDRGANVETN